MECLSKSIKSLGWIARHVKVDSVQFGGETMKFLCIIGIHDYEVYREWLTETYPRVIYKCRCCNKMKYKYI